MTWRCLDRNREGGGHNNDRYLIIQRTLPSLHITFFLFSRIYSARITLPLSHALRPLLDVIINIIARIITRQVHFRNVVTNLHPLIAASRYGEEPTQQVVRARGHNEAGKEVDIIYVGSTNGDLYFGLKIWVGFGLWEQKETYLSSDRAGEADNIDQNASNVGGICAPVNAQGVKVRAGLSR
jgi:hypothetical protein